MAAQVKHCHVFGLENSVWSWKQRAPAGSDYWNEEVINEITLLEDDDFVKGWKKVTSVPSEVHVELMKINAIPNPYVGFNEHKVQWIGDVEWLYRCVFPFDVSGSHQHALLTFEGLDAICDVYLNAKKILSTDNQFRTYTVSLDRSQGETKAPLSDENTLLLHFKSAKGLAKAEEAKYGKVRAGSTNLGDPSRVYVRKAQYDWRWDWGPELMTCGPYRSISLTRYDARIEDLNTHAKVIIDQDDTFQATLVADVTLDGDLELLRHGSLDLKLFGADGHTVQHTKMPIEEDTTARTVSVTWTKLHEHGVELWWPVKYGNQALYTVEVSLANSTGETVDTMSKRIGFRTVELVQEELQEEDQYGKGTSFFFKINGISIFMGGSNWIPADSFLTQISDERYRAWLTMLRDGNQNMVRLWGGGIYEPDIFYDICDELGILVWQDFQFACGVYPAHDYFINTVKHEAEDNVRRLRHHPSLALFCGNNEDYQMVLQWGGIDQLPARILYEKEFPDIVSRLTDPPIPYHRGSPYGGKGWDTSDPTIGDVHQWNVWGGKELPYQEYDRLGGRFVSEFGIPSMPSMSTIKSWMAGADESQFYSQSQLMAQHTKAGSFERRFAIVMNENFRLTSDFATHVFNTQLMQSEAVSFAYRSWRREWRGSGKEYNGGVLVWQLNDCWPVVSWAIVDYFLRAKPVYYTIMRQLSSVSVGVFRLVHKNRDNDRPRQFYEYGAIQATGASLQIWASNNTVHEIPVNVETRFFDLYSDWSDIRTVEGVVLLPNQTTEITEMDCLYPQHEAKSTTAPFTGSGSVVVCVRLIDPTSETVLARFSDWPEPYRFLSPPDPKLTISVVDSGTADEKMVTLDVQRPAKCVFLSAEEDLDQSGFSCIKWTDNAVDLVPGDPQQLSVEGLNNRKIKYNYFGQPDLA
ncbi:glycoside hydrolase family 2 protein [Crepidotus variabilis]|uniref:Beta-mannosidase B n=1 Tax=Crepidotus variabilis TaxID=179855 RepID=A0A9P6E697_9AGAR|nr:glycoside hydrolase family 2 protein [Crepidotus variabilis]